MARFGPVFRRLGQDGSTQILHGNKKVADDIRNLLTTPLGTRFNFPLYGSKLHTLRFQLMDETFESLVNIYIAEAINSCMPSMDIKTVIVTPNQEEQSATIDVVFVDKRTGEGGMTSVVFADGMFS